MLDDVRGDNPLVSLVTNEIRVRLTGPHVVDLLNARRVDSLRRVLLYQFLPTGMVEMLDLKLVLGHDGIVAGSNLESYSGEVETRENSVSSDHGTRSSPSAISKMTASSTMTRSSVV